MIEGTLIDLLERAALSDYGIRLVDAKEDSTFYSYRELYSRAQQMGSWLRKLGIRPGDRVSLVLPTCVGFFDAFFGALFCGAVPVPIYPPIRLGRLDEYHQRTATMLRAVDTRVLLSDRRVNRLLGRTVEQFMPELGVHTVETIALSERVPVPKQPRRADDLAFIQFSSGTTAAPKPIRLSHTQILANVSAILDQILTAYPEINGFEHSGCSWLPLYHDMGLIGCVFVAMGRPRDLTLIPPEVFVTNPAIWLRSVSRYGATISPAPNFAYSLCVDRIKDREIAGIDLSRWVVAMNGAEPVTPKVLERFVERFGAYGLPPRSLTPVYGLGEASLAVTFSPLNARWKWFTFDREMLANQGIARTVSGDGVELVSLGPSLPGFEVSVRDPDGNEIGENRLGCVWVRGPSLMQGYHGMHEETQRVYKGEWLDTGDRGFCFDGELFLFGRGKDTVILNGRNFAPQDIERALDGMEGVRPGCYAAIGVTHEDGERLSVLVETSDVTGRERADLRLRIRQGILERCGLPCEVVILDRGALPRTSSGKIARARARELFETGTLSKPRPVTPLRMFGELLKSLRGHTRAEKGRP